MNVTTNEHHEDYEVVMNVETNEHHEDYEVVEENFINQYVMNQNESYGTVQKNQAPKTDGISSPEDKLDAARHEVHHSSNVCLLVCFIILLIGFVATVVAILVAFVLIANLHSEMESIKLESCTSSLISTMPSKTDALSILRTSIMKLDGKLQMFSNEIEQVFDDLQNNVNELEDEANNLTNISNRVHQIQAAVEMRISKHEYSLGAQFVEYTLNITNQLNILMQETYIYISSAHAAAHTSADELTTKIVRDIQELHVFESCNAINTFSLPFSSGEYTINTSTGHTIMSCILFPSCNNMTGGWRRVAYLNTSECPHGLVKRTSPPSCRLPLSIVDGCSSIVTYQTEGSYNCISGSIIAHQSGNPDAFTNGLRGSRSEITLGGNYVDGVSLTYGNKTKHIWTFTAVVSEDGIDCGRCNTLKPLFVGNNYSCEVTRLCGSNTNVCNGPLWDGEEQCVGGSTFHRQLLEPTSADIELRVCRDQVQTDEDFSLNVVEIYVR